MRQRRRHSRDRRHPSGGPGAAYSAWLAYFDRPAACKTRPCGLPDLAGRDPPGVVARLDGAVAGMDRALQFAAEFRGLRLSPGSQLSVLVYDHGPAIDRDIHYRARQLLSRGLRSVAYPAAGPPGDWNAGELVAGAVFTYE